MSHLTCRLCLQTCTEQKQLYDEHGARNDEIYNKMRIFFNPKFLNIPMTICLTCWQRIFEFHDLLTNHAYNQRYNITTDNGSNSYVITFKPELADASFDRIAPIKQNCIKTELMHTQTEDEAETYVLNEFADDETQDNEFLTKNIKDEVSIEQSIVNLNEPLITKTSVKVKPLKKTRTRKTPTDLDVIIAHWKAILECGICQKPHTSFLHLSQHFIVEHPNEKPHILCCKRKLLTRSEIADHANFHTNAESFKCQDCDTCCTNRAALRMHMYRVHSAKAKYGQHICGVCAQRFQTASMLEQHMTDHTHKQLYQCIACSHTFRFYTDILKHSKASHPHLSLERENKLYKSVTLSKRDDTQEPVDGFITQWISNLECDICQTVHTNFSLLTKHFSLEHPKEEAYILCLCQQKLQPRLDIADLDSVRVDLETFKCQGCGMRVANRGSLRMNSGKRIAKRHVCHICDKRFQTARLLEEHVAGHLKTKLYKCSICSKSFRHRSTLYKHLTEAHSEIGSKKQSELYEFVSDSPKTSKSLIVSKKYDEVIKQWKPSLECGICQNLHNNFSLLKQHFSLEHPKEKTHLICCKRKLIDRRAAAEHASFHMNPETFKCQECGLCVASRSSLRMHIYRVHSGRAKERKHICSVCDKQFQTPFMLKEHMAGHENKDLYKCIACSNTCRYRSDLYRHMRKTHPQIYAEKKGKLYERLSDS